MLQLITLNFNRNDLVKPLQLQIIMCVLKMVSRQSLRAVYTLIGKVGPENFVKTIKGDISISDMMKLLCRDQKSTPISIKELVAVEYSNLIPPLYFKFLQL